MVGHNVQHDIDVSSMALRDEINEILLCPKVGIELEKVPASVAMVVSIIVIHDRGNPDGIEPHALDIVQVSCQPQVAPPTVVTQV